jgi:hypothetical protein
MHELLLVPDRSPELFPYALDGSSDGVTFIRLTRADFEKASFLDARVLAPATLKRTLSWPTVFAAIDAARLSENCGFIFHIGHVGSTLLSRLMGGHPGVFALREPMLLRAFAQLHTESMTQTRAWGGGDWEARLSGTLKLLSRTFQPRQFAVIKATSLVSELAGPLLSRVAAPKAVMMYVSPETYLSTILGGANSRQEARMLTPNRLSRLQRRIGGEAWQAASLSEGETLALGWACEMSALAQAARTAQARVLRIDFDQLLASPAMLLLSVLHHFGVDAAPSDVAAILAGPDMNRYSKAPEHAYDAALRRDVLDSARAIHGAEIKRGLAWLERAADRFDAVRAAMEFAQP